MDLKQKIAKLEKEIRETPYHKGTEHHIGLLRARIAKLQDELLERQTKKAGGGTRFAIKKTGDATVVLVGPPSVGKSTLLNALTNARSPVAPYDFTTVRVIPGMMKYKGASIQILDVPGLIGGASRGKGHGKEVLSVIRAADLLILVTEVGKENTFKQMEDELYKAGVRINQKPAKIKIEKKTSGGLIIRNRIKQPFNNQTIKDIAQEFGLRNGEIILKESLALDRLIDVFCENRVYVDTLHLVNKSDLNTHLHTLTYVGKAILVSGKTGKGLMALKQAIWNKLKLVRVYLKKPNGKPDYGAPLIIKEGGTLLAVAEKIGQDFAFLSPSLLLTGCL